MEDPFLVIEQSSQPMETGLAAARRQVYEQYKDKFEKMVKKVTKSHNKPDFAKIAEFLQSGDEEPEIVPTCLLINSN